MSKELTLGVHGISKSFDGINIINKATACFENGKINIILGENASGKTTLIKMISGSLVPDEGYFTINNLRFDPANKNNSICFPSISVVYQNRTLIPELTVIENVFLGCYPVHKFGIIDNKSMLSAYNSIIENIGFYLNPNTLVKNLNSAEKRIVELAKAFSHESDIIIFDEPSSNFSSLDLEKFYKFIQKLKSNGKLIIYITHNINEALSIGNAFFAMYNGSILSADTSNKPDSINLLKMISGNEFKYRYPSINSFISTVIMDIKIRSTYRLRNIEFSLRKGEVLGITGLLGSYKSEIGSALIGLIPMDGTVSMFGVNIKIHSPKDALEHGISYIHEYSDECVVPDFIPSENITLSNLEYVSATHFIDKKKEEMIAYGFFRRLNINQKMIHTQSQFLSGGTKQKLCIARALLSDSRIIVMNEPTQSIDAASRSDLYNLMNDYKRRGGSIILISSDFDEIAGMSDRILIVKNNTLSAELLKNEINSSTLYEHLVSQDKAQ